MAVEIEAKFKVDELDVYVQRLEHLGAQPLLSVRQCDQYFDHENQRLLHGNCGLRLRQETAGRDEKITLCFKGPIQPGRYKSRREINCPLLDYAAAQELLEALGYLPTIRVEKQRRETWLGDCLVCLDEVTRLGSFIEIEGPSEADVQKTAERLGLAEFKHLPKTYTLMLAELDEK